MIRLFFGNIGSGKTACAVREIVLHRYKPHPVITNIEIKGVNRVIPLCIENIVETYEDAKGKLKYRLNENYWKEIKEKYGCVDIVIDEAHLILNARRSGSNINVIMGDFIALLRRIVGGHGGSLTLITQLERRLDVISKEMATSVFHYRCHFKQRCICGYGTSINSDMPEISGFCPRCLKKLQSYNFIIEVHRFRNIYQYEMWNNGANVKHLIYFVNDIEKYFPLYDTLQWKDLVSSLYS